MLYLVIAVLFLHFLSLPIVVSTAVYIDYDKDSGEIKLKLWLFTVYKKSLDIGRFKQKLEGLNADGGIKPQPPSEQEKQGNGGVKKFLLAFAKNCAKRVRVRDFDLDLKLGTGDAAVSAFVVGTVKVFYQSACAFLGLSDGGAVIEPIYDNEYIFLDLFGIFSISFADIIYAACATTVESIPKRSTHANTVTE